MTQSFAQYLASIRVPTPDAPEAVSAEMQAAEKAAHFRMMQPTTTPHDSFVTGPSLYLEDPEDPNDR